MTATTVRAPYITPYSEERICFDVALTPDADAANGRKLTYVNPAPDDWMLGVLWARQEGHRRGRPLLRDVHTTRQRECMLGRLCQVCHGSALHDGRVWWLLPQGITAPTATLSKSPTCPACIPMALASCRAMAGACAYSSADYEPSAVLGHVFIRSAGGLQMAEGVRPGFIHEIPLDATRFVARTLARALMVHTWDLRREETPA